jgi:CRP-like cAMP-binding protein
MSIFHITLPSKLQEIESEKPKPPELLWECMVELSTEGKIELFRNSRFLGEAEEKTLIALAEATRECCYPKGTIITQNNKNTDEIFIVSCGLLKVSAISESGKRITFLLAKKGDPYNILTPFMTEPRQFIAEAAKDTRCLQMSRARYMQFIEEHPELLIHIISWVAPALDSTISRIFDQMEKKVEFRIMRVLKTLAAKLGLIAHLDEICHRNRLM